jgi:hypothetical protein
MVKRKDECSIQKRMFRDIMILVVSLVALFILARAAGFI